MQVGRLILIFVEGTCQLVPYARYKLDTSYYKLNLETAGNMTLYFFCIIEKNISFNITDTNYKTILKTVFDQCLEYQLDEKRYLQFKSYPFSDLLRRGRQLFVDLLCNHKIICYSININIFTKCISINRYTSTSLIIQRLFKHIYTTPLQA